MLRYLLLYMCCCLTCGSILAQEMVFTTRPAAKRVGTQDRFEVRYSIQNAGNIQRFSLPALTDFDVVGGPMQSQSTSYVNGERTSSVDLTYVFKAKHKGTCTIPGGMIISDGKTYRSNDVAIDVIDGSVQQNQARPRSNNPFDDPFFQDPFGGGDPFAAIQKQQQQMLQQLQQMQRGMGQAQPVPRQMMPQAQPSEPVSKDEVANNIFIRVDVDKKEVALGEQVTAVYKLYTRMPMQVNLTKLPSLV